ncbi:MAG: TonB-dependent receptor [Bacteroidales bacterium]
MKRTIVSICLLGFALCVEATTNSNSSQGAVAPVDSLQKADTLKAIIIDNVIISATRASKRSPLTYAEVDKKQVAAHSTGQDLPFLLLATPSVVATSDAGAGIGYSSIRIRGTDASRINVTANDIPMNDAESHSLFWVNMPDLTSSIEDIQVQRGVGASTNGAGAFGGSINMRTAAPEQEPYAELMGMYGAFNTHREVIKVGTGRIKKQFAFDARLSNIHSDGYVDRASTDLQSYFVQGAYFGASNSLKFITFSGKEKTYHAWNGVEKEILETNRTYNSAGEMWSRGEFLGFYDNQTDNYKQTHYHLLFNQNLSSEWLFDLKLHYTDGAGYYEEYRNDRRLIEYRLKPFVMAGDSLITNSNLVRRKQMDNAFGGVVFAMNYHDERLKATLGGAVNQYKGTHFGRVIWVQDYVGNLQPEHEYYRNQSSKNDMNIYLKGDVRLTDALSLYTDLQYRHINHFIEGENDKWDWTVEQQQALNVDQSFHFFNPKAGLFYQLNKQNSMYASFAVAHKEPTRNNYTDARVDQAARPERLMDTEVGYTYQSPYFSLGATLYHMNYKDQLVLTGALNEIGEPIAENVAKSYRMGIELTLGMQITKWLNWDLNATFSRNKILDYTEYVDAYDEAGLPLYTQAEVHHRQTDISFAPWLTGGSVIRFEHKGWAATLQSNYVSQQYLSNAQQAEASLDAYFVSNLMLSYTFKLPLLRELVIRTHINNVFNEQYESNGWGGSLMIGNERSNYAGYFPQAGIHLMGSLSLKF